MNRHKTTKTQDELNYGEPNCKKCKLLGRPKIEGFGKEGADIMVVRQAPSAGEAGQGRLFVDPAGQFIRTQLVQHLQTKLEDCYITSACSCCPEGVKQPTALMQRACQPRLLAEIEWHNPKQVITLGSVAQQSILPAYPLVRYHGKKILLNGRIYVPMYSPFDDNYSAFLRQVLLNDFIALPAQAPIEEIDGNYQIGDLSPEAFEGDLVTIDTETIGLYGELLGGAIALIPKAAIYYPYKALIQCLQDCPEWRHFLFHNAKYDLHVLADNGYDWHGKEIDDTQLLAYCMAYPSLRLKVLETQELNLTHFDYDSMVEGGTLADIPMEQTARYCCQDTDATRRLWDYLLQEADEREISLYETIEKPLLPVLVDMERLGIRLDRQFTVDWDNRLAAGIEEVSQQLEATYNLAPEVLSSPKQFGSWLVEQGIDLPITEASGQYATGKRVLAAHINDHPIIPLLLKRRQLMKLKSTYAEAYLELADDNDLIHTQYNQTRVVTGRLSSSHPNLQNLPYVFDARRPFIAREGNKLVSFDYSQIDMRVLAYIAQDKGLLEAFLRDEDIHNWMCDELFGNHEPMNRHIIKGASYQILYGGSAKGLYIQLSAPMGEFDIDKFGKPPTLAQCTEIMSLYFTKFPGIKRYQDDTKAFALKHGYVEDYFGRRRYLPNVTSSIRNVQAAALRMAINLPIAGTAASLFKMSIIVAGRYLTPVLNVHDELVFDIPEDKVDYWIPILQHALQTEVAFPVPLKVKYNVGNNLGELI